MSQSSNISPKPAHGSLVLSQREIGWQARALALELGQELLQRQLIDARADLMLALGTIDQLSKGEREKQ